LRFSSTRRSSIRSGPRGSDEAASKTEPRAFGAYCGKRRVGYLDLVMQRERHRRASGTTRRSSLGRTVPTTSRPPSPVARVAVAPRSAWTPSFAAGVGDQS
jgi:hypothetical protein